VATDCQCCTAFAQWAGRLRSVHLLNARPAAGTRGWPRESSAGRGIGPARATGCSYSLTVPPEPLEPLAPQLGVGIVHEPK
jgi:hypothetical protein